MLAGNIVIVKPPLVYCIFINHQKPISIVLLTTDNL